MTTESRGMKPKINRVGDTTKSSTFDCCQTPAYALDPILPYLKKDWVIWEPAKGEGNICTTLAKQNYDVIGTDVLDGHNFFTHQPSHFDCIVTNPPYSIKYTWMQRCYELGKPFALLMPLETMGAASGQRLFKQYGYEWILLDKRINFKMPEKGYSGKGAQFPVAWFCWQLTGQSVTFASINRRNDSQNVMPLFELAA